MPSLNNFHIELDRPGAVYMPGEMVSGYVIIDLAKEKIAEALKLSAKGEAYVRWTEQQSTTDMDGKSQTTTVSYIGNEKYFSVTTSLLEKSEDGKVHIPAGLSRYPFRIQLPRDIPCSFEYHKLIDGHVRYTLKAIIVRSWRFNHECKVAFTIITNYDLNIRREQCFGIDDEIHQAFSCLCCISNGSINMRVKLPTTGFVPGQWIEVFLDLTDTTSTELEKICVKLKQSIDFCASSSTRNVKTTVVAAQKTAPFNKDADFLLRLLIPSIPPSELQFCNIIHIKYILRVVLHNSKMYCKIVREYPILIGTIPLRLEPFTPEPSTSSHHYQPTSKNEDMTPESNIVPSAPPNSSLTNEFLDDLAPPSYEECCTNRALYIKDLEESMYVYGANEPFAPKYPVFKFPT